MVQASEYSQSILTELNDEQKDAVTSVTGPVLIIAGAGTGKTTVIARRIAYLVAQELAKPHEILALTFTDKAANEMEERVDQLLPFGIFDTQISTFHSFGEKILRDNALVLGLPTDFAILTRPQQVLFLQQHLFRFQLKHYRPLATPTKFIHALITLFSRAKDETITPEEFTAFATKLVKNKQIDPLESEQIVELATAFQQYEEFKAQAGVLDFGDLIVKVKELFENHPAILKKYQKQYKYILVDEYQDTNYAQNEIVKLLAQKHKNLCVVGDDDQSIYRFRGAAISNILAFEKTYPKCKKIVLTNNYRSTQPILDAAYKLITNNNPDRLEAKHNISKKLLSTKSDTGFPIQTIFTPTLAQETDTVVAEIDRLVNPQTKKKNLKLNGNPPGFDEPISYNDIAILVRANAHAEPFLQALNAKGIPSKFTGTTGLYETEEIKKLITWLAVLANFNDNLSLYSLAVSDFYVVPIADLVKAMDLARKKSRPLYWVFEHIDSLQEYSDVSNEGLTTIQTLMDDIATYGELSKSMSVGKVLYQFLTDRGILDTLQQEQSAQAATQVSNIAKFFDKIAEFTKLATNHTPQAFIDYLTALRDAGDDPGTATVEVEYDGVNVMTVHAAKGLEFKVVFIVNAVADRFPARNKSEPLELPLRLIKETLPEGDFHLQEERRLFYVALTRAAELLYITWSQDYGGKRLKKVSPFVAESLGLENIPTPLFAPTTTKKIEQLNLFWGPTPQQIAIDNVEPQLTLLIDEERLLTLNQAQVEEYLTCPKRYEYSTLLKIPLGRNHLFVYGTAIHTAIQAFYKAKMHKTILPLPNMIGVFERAWVDEGFLSQEHEAQRFDQGKVAISQFWQREKDNKTTPTWIEKQFKIALPNNIKIIGRFDRVDITGETAKIIDYKTTENMDEVKAKKRAKESTQLAVYSLAFYKLFNKLPNEVSLYFVDNGVVGSYAPTMDTISKAQEYITQVAAGVRDNNFQAKPDLISCQFCAYSTICPFAVNRP